MSARIQHAFHAAQKQRDHAVGLAIETLLNDAFSIEQLQIDLESEVATYEVLSETLESLEANPALESTFEVPANPYIDVYSLEANGASGKLKEVAGAVWEKIKEIFAKIKAFFKALFEKIMDFFAQMKFEALAWWKPALVVELEVSSDTTSYLRGALKGQSIDLKPAIGAQGFEAHLKKLEQLQEAAANLSGATAGFFLTQDQLVRKTAEIAKAWDGCTVQIGPWSINRSLNAEGTPRSIGELAQAMHQTAVSEVQEHAKNVKLALRLDDVKAMQHDLHASSSVTGPMKRLVGELDRCEARLHQLVRGNSGQSAQLCLQSAGLVAKVSRAIAGDIQKYAQVVQKGYDVYKVAVRNARRDLKVADNEPIDAKVVPRIEKAAATA